jgi:6-pyruvoyltetrahydropterin/6-carboxytetrahydropterin synthase
MTKIRVTKSFGFETGHALYGHDGLCKNIHGHSYKLFVTVIGKPIIDANHAKNGMVIDFKDLKTIVKSEIVDVFDHAMVLNINSPHSELATVLSSQEHKVIRVDYQPTSENMVIDFANRIASKLPSHIKLFKVRLNETATAYAEWYASDQE